MYLQTSVNWANLSSTVPEYIPTQKIVCQENIYGRGKNCTGTRIVLVVKVTCKMAIAPHRDTARASLKTIEDYWR